ncbi:MAG: A/G-specific adenine glycosylase [Fulvivirga sp.]|nr:A/G-specific adenine glycosylase [Fulvivirga sp.]
MTKQKTNLPFITKNIIEWYSQHGRDLPWRKTRDPYKIWLSEIILQQTRVQQGLPYYEKFVEKFPHITDLAQATEEEVLRTWQGLGYYSRARNLHACAKVILEKYNGSFPSTYQELLKLPGIGPYTAAAISSFAFKEKVPAIDGNVFRVLARIFGVAEDILSGKARKTFENIARELIPDQFPDTYNQAMMEFGARHCTPRNPSCAVCPVGPECYARLNNCQDQLPVKRSKVKVKNRFFTYLVIQHQGKYWMKQRKAGDIWQGLYDFCLLEEKNNDEVLKTVLLPEVKLKNGKTFKHILTHQKIYARFISVQQADLQKSSRAQLLENGEFYGEDKIKDLPKPVLIDNYLNEVIF